MYAKVGELVGKTLKTIILDRGDDDKILFNTVDDEEYMLYHQNECYEAVNIEDIVGDLEDLVGTPILMAEEISNDDTTLMVDQTLKPGNNKWTFYKFATIKGYVTIRWYGISGGFYSDSVEFAKKVNGKWGYV